MVDREEEPHDELPLMPDSEPALWQHFPELRDRIPRVSLGNFPTPVERVRVPGLAHDLWVKRDDRSGEVYGGNKVRKLEFLLGAARRDGAKRLLTIGAFGSHHALATVVYGSRLGFRTTLVLMPQPVTEHVREVLLLDFAYGAELRFARMMATVPLAVLRARLAHRGEGVALIPPGGSSALGTLGYVNGALELAAQIERGEAPRPDKVYAPAGTLGTVVGIALGFAVAGLETRVIGVRVASRLLANRRGVRLLARRTLRLLEDAGARVPAVDAVASRIQLVHEQIGPGYGHATEEGYRATARLAEAGLALDPTYTAKAAAAVLAAAESEPDRRHLFWHTLSAGLPPSPLPELTVADLPPPFRRLAPTTRGG